MLLPVEDVEQRAGLPRSFHDAAARQIALRKLAPNKHGFFPGVCESATPYVSVGQVTGIPKYVC